MSIDVKYAEALCFETENWVNIQHAIRGKEYFLKHRSNGEPIVVIPVKGKIKQHHYRVKNNTTSGGGTGGLESPEHYALKLEIANKGYLIHRGLKIQATKVDLERKIKGGIYFPDVIFYGSDGEILCLVEVVHTNPLTAQKKKDLLDAGYIIFIIKTKELNESNYDKREFKTKVGGDVQRTLKSEGAKEEASIAKEILGYNEFRNRNFDRTYSARIPERVNQERRRLRDCIDRERIAAIRIENEIERTKCELERTEVKIHKARERLLDITEEIALAEQIEGLEKAIQCLIVKNKTLF